MVWDCRSEPGLADLLDRIGYINVFKTDENVVPALERVMGWCSTHGNGRKKVVDSS